MAKTVFSRSIDMVHILRDRTKSLLFAFLEYNLSYLKKHTLMSSENERLQNSSEGEVRKKSGHLSANDSKRSRGGENGNEIGHGSIKYFSPPPQMMQRPPMDSSGNRAAMSHPVLQKLPQLEDSDLTDAMVFLNRIRDEYADNLYVYDNFLETMRDFKFEKIDADEVCKAVRILFKDKPYLVRLFDEYLPHHLRFGETMRSYDMQQDRAKFNQFRGPAFMSKPPTPMHMGQVLPNTTIHMSRLNHPIPPPPFMARSLRQSPPPSMGSEPINRIKQMHYAEPDSPKHRMANEFVQLVKKRYLNRPLVYKQFVDLLQNSKNSFEKLFTQVSALLCETPDLVDRFERNFRATQLPSEPAYSSDIDPLRKIKHILAEKGVLDQFLKIINFYNQNYISSADLVAIVEPIIGNDENMAAFKSFIRFEEVSPDHEVNKYRGLEKIGSYRLLPVKLHIATHSSLPKDVLNDICVCVSTHESEDDTYIFRNKNHSEELISRVVDERSESDLLMDRLKFLIVKLEELYECLGDGELDMDDIQMSSALVKETLKSIYGNKSSEMLEAILTNPKKAIPVILKRLGKVYKNNSSRVREFKKFWRSIADEHYYKAYDTKGVIYRSQEKNYLSLKHVQLESSIPYSVQILDTRILGTIKDLFGIFVKSHSSNGSRKVPVADQVAMLDSVIDSLMKSSLVAVVNFDTYALYYFVLTLYARFYEIRQIKLERITSNPIAVSVDLQDEFCVEDRYQEIVNSAKELMNKNIDADKFEESVRRMSDSMGYKLYNLKKIISKMEKQVNALINVCSDNSKEEEDIDGGNYSLSKCEDIVTICKIEDNHRDEKDVIIKK